MSTGNSKAMLMQVGQMVWQRVMLLLGRLHYCFIADEVVYITQLDAFDPSRSVKLVQAEKTPELMHYMEQISGVVNYVNQTFSLFSEVERVRPVKLLK